MTSYDTVHTDMPLRLCLSSQSAARPIAHETPRQRAGRQARGHGRASGARQATGRPAIALAAAWLRGWLRAERGEGGGPRARLDTLGDPRGEG